MEGGRGAEGTATGPTSPDVTAGGVGGRSNSGKSQLQGGGEEEGVSLRWSPHRRSDVACWSSLWSPSSLCYHSPGRECGRGQGAAAAAAAASDGGGASRDLIS